MREAPRSFGDSDARGAVNELLTTSDVNITFTRMDDSHSPLHWDRDVMATLLLTNVQLVAGVLRADNDGSPGQTLRAIAATRSLDMIVEDTLRALVEQARAAGHTWAEIGELLHVSRQAAFQRFGGGRRPGAQDEVAVPVDGAVEAAVPVLQAFLDGRFDDARMTFAQRMLDACSVELMADVREKVRQYGGAVQTLGTPVVSVRGGYTGVDIPVALEHADGVGRVVLDADRQVVGFFVRPAEAMA
ncbi:MAG: hypothetical protein JO363_07845 [Solirubrobacterales bacterium]|nr:hypothetical protein [Solirubrobacterales bacterium]